MAHNSAARLNRKMFESHFWRLAIYFAAAFVLAQAADARELRIEKFDAQGDGFTERNSRCDGKHHVPIYRALERRLSRDSGRVQHAAGNELFAISGREADHGQQRRKLKYESSRVRHYRKLKIYVPGAEDTTKTIVIEYTVSDALRFFDDHDEFYWNVTGDEWDMPIANARANITLPVGTTGIRTNLFTGAYRSTENRARQKLWEMALKCTRRRHLVTTRA